MNDTFHYTRHGKFARIDRKISNKLAFGQHTRAIINKIDISHLIVNLWPFVIRLFYVVLFHLSAADLIFSFDLYNLIKNEIRFSIMLSISVLFFSVVSSVDLFCCGFFFVFTIQAIRGDIFRKNANVWNNRKSIHFVLLAVMSKGSRGRMHHTVMQESNAKYIYIYR